MGLVTTKEGQELAFLPCEGIRTCQPLLPSGSVSQEFACNTEDLGLIHGSRRSCEGGHDCPLQYSCLDNSMDRGASWITAHGLAKS